jgi:hypothetical protein
MTESEQGILHDGENSRGYKVCLEAVTKVCGTARDFTFNFVFGPEYSESCH